MRTRTFIDEVGDPRIEASQTAAIDDAGVDLSLVDYMLSLSPAERLDAIYQHARSVASLLPRERPD
jgi:hypothetical protein